MSLAVCGACRGRGYDHLVNHRSQVAKKSRRDIEKDAPGAHLLELLVSNAIAVLDGIDTCIDRRLDTIRRDGVRSHAQLLAMRLLHDRRQFAGREVVLDGDFDHIDVVLRILTHRLSALVRARDAEELL